MCPRNSRSVLRLSAVWLWVLILALALSSCVFRRLRADMETFEKQWSLLVDLDVKEGTQREVVVVIYTPYEDGQRVAAFKAVDPQVGRLFLQEFGSGIYALEAYDPNRTPVLFINGAGGSA